VTTRGLSAAFQLLFLTAGIPAADVTTETLLREMLDLEHLTRFPAPAYKTVQFSSYDRLSVAPYAPNWSANADGFGGEPIPGFVRVAREPDANGVGTYVMAEVEGPGAVVRTWTAAIEGTIRLVLDGAEKPSYEGPAGPFLTDPFTALGGDAAAAGGANGFAQREAGYFPIPFAKRCLMLFTGRKDDTHFYQVQIRCYEAGTNVVTFTREDLTACARQIAETSAALAKPDRPVQAGTSVAFSESAAPRESKSLFASDKGPAAITSFSVRIEAPNVEKALRQTVLRMYFDGAQNPQVESPIGDFFGAGPGVNPYTSVPVTVAADGTMTSRFVMPFAQAVKIVAENWSPDQVVASGALGISPYSWDKERSMHFFAHWRADHGLWARRAGEVVDLPFLCARGKGVYVGTAAIIMNPTPVPTPSGGWWGEGDEKIWVDDDTFPSTFGTGSEDYFNYAWSVPDLFCHAYFAQPLTTGPGNRGYVSNIRWHIIDALPFKESLFFFMELFPHMPTPGLSYARLSYFYAFPRTRDDHVPISPDAARIPPLPEWLPFAAGGCAGARFIQAETCTATATGGVVSRPEAAMYAGGRALWWDAHGPDDTLEIVVPVTKKGTYHIGLTLVHAPVCDHLQVALDGKPIFRDGRLVGAFTPHLTMLRSDVGDQDFALEPGDHRLTIKAVTKEGTGVARPVGIDFIWLAR
jgi:hypothetical protein